MHDTNQEQPDEETHRARSPGGELVCPVLMESRCIIILLAHQCVYQPGSPTELQCPEVSLGFHFLWRTELFIGHVIEFNLQRQAAVTWLQAPLFSYNYIITCLDMTSPHPETSYNKD